MRERVRQHGATVVVVVVAAVMLGPALLPGYTLIGDQVFVPDQSLLPWMLGLGAGLPRSVPQDAVVAVLTGPVPGWVWESVALVSALVLLGLGVARLLRDQGVAARTIGAVVAVWSPYVGERLLLGHWSLLLAVAALPWALDAADAARRGSRRATARWVLWVALASLTVSGGLLVLAMTLPVLLWRDSAPVRPRWLAAVAGLVLQAPWLVPALLHPSALGSGGVEVFALRPEGAWGGLLTALGTGGVWNADAVPGSRGTLLAPLLTLVLLAAAWWGRGDVAPAVGRPVALVLGVGSVLGIAVAVLGAWSITSGVTEWVTAHVPGAGVLRDGQKWLAPWLLLLAVSAALGARRAARSLVIRTRDRAVGPVLLIGGLLVPIALLPDLAWGVGGRLASVDYPADWSEVRSVLASDPRPGDVISLPWSTFRRFDWNRGRTVLDPAPRALPRTVVASDSLVVRRDGALVVVPGDDPRSVRVGAVVSSGADLAPVLAALGIGWAVVAADAGPVSLPAGSELVVDGPDLDLYALAPPARIPAPTGVVAVLLGDLLAGGVLVGAGFVLLRRRRTTPD